MGVRVNDSIAKKLTLQDDSVVKSTDQGLLHQRQEEEKAHEYRASVAEKKSENYIIQNYIKRSQAPDDRAILQAYEAQVLHKEAGTTARNTNLHRPAKSLRRKQSRNFVSTLAENTVFGGKSIFFFFAHGFERVLSAILPAPEARTVSVLATVMLMVGIVFAAISIGPDISQGIANLSPESAASPMRQSPAFAHISHVSHMSSRPSHGSHSSHSEHSAKYLSQSRPTL